MEAELKTDRVAVKFETSLINRIDDFGFGNRIRSRAKTIRELILIGLEHAEKEKGNDVTA
ncbi:hypothetical protein [Pararhizobium gei]|uniref:hypothetical protein n=1 Tax=Pararhizobium gei TaxID=1395951 RepID=UPI0023DC1B24|nr:hypothetical protein [Rhizobium gei]